METLIVSSLCQTSTVKVSVTKSNVFVVFEKDNLPEVQFTLFREDMNIGRPYGDKRYLIGQTTMLRIGFELGRHGFSLADTGSILGLISDTRARWLQEFSPC